MFSMLLVLFFAISAQAQNIPECGQQFGFTGRGQSCYNGSKKTSCQSFNKFQTEFFKLAKPTKIETSYAINCGNIDPRDCAPHISDYFNWGGGTTTASCDVACKDKHAAAARSVVNSLGGSCLDNQSKPGSDELNIQKVKVSSVSGSYINTNGKQLCRCIVTLTKQPNVAASTTKRAPAKKNSSSGRTHN